MTSCRVQLTGCDDVLSCPTDGVRWGAVVTGLQWAELYGHFDDVRLGMLIYQVRSGSSCSVIFCCNSVNVRNSKDTIIPVLLV